MIAEFRRILFVPGAILFAQFVIWQGSSQGLMNPLYVWEIFDFDWSGKAIFMHARSILMNIMAVGGGIRMMFIPSKDL